jgi:ADP-heptose:LPS heptosyltransferase
LLGLLDWPELAAVMTHACLVVTDDAGYLALADALPRPMVGVGPLSEPGDAWQPAGAAARLIDNVHEGAGCHLEPIVEAAVGVLEATAGTFTPYDALASHRHLG